MGLMLKTLVCCSEDMHTFTRCFHCLGWLETVVKSEVVCVGQRLLVNPFLPDPVHLMVLKHLNDSAGIEFYKVNQTPQHHQELCNRLSCTCSLGAAVELLGDL